MIDLRGLGNAAAFVRVGAVALFFALMMWTGEAWAGELPAPQGKVLLSITGNIAHTNADVSGGRAAQFDRAQLEALGMHTLETTNPFIEGVHAFSGVRLSDVLDAVGASGKVLVARALDGYSVNIPFDDAYDFTPLLVMKIDGVVIRVRTKGPLWIVYPVDQVEALKNEIYSTRSVWQLKSLDVK